MVDVFEHVEWVFGEAWLWVWAEHGRVVDE